MGKMDQRTNSIDGKGGIVLEKDEFCENIRLCEKSMYYLAFSLMRNEADATEVVSESIYRAYKNLNTLKHKKFFKAWILKIIHNTAVETIRKNSKIVPMEDIEENIKEVVNNDLTTQITLKEAVDNLRQPYQTVVILFYYENLSIIEISRITNSSVVSVKKQLSRARKMLLEGLKEDFNI